MMVMEMAVMAVYMVMFMGMNPALMPMSMVHDNRAAVVAAVASFVVLAGRGAAGPVARPGATAAAPTPARPWARRRHRARRRWARRSWARTCSSC